MIEISNTAVYGFDAAIRGMRNPLESWDKMDSHPYIYNCKAYEVVGPNDRELMKKLASAGPDHGKFMRMINVTCDITAPLYWWKEYDTYKVGTVANSCSTMHKIQAHEFTLDMFSHEHLISVHDIDEINDEGYIEIVDDFENQTDLCGVIIGDDHFMTPYGSLGIVIKELNRARELYLKTNDKKYWWQMIQLLPTSYNQKRTVQLNYQVLKNMYHARKNHKLDEWHVFCDWVETLPESDLITEAPIVKKAAPIVEL